jgi:hypothetical protein
MRAPEAVEGDVLKRYEENLVAVQGAEAEVAKVTGRLMKLVGEKGALDSKPGVNRWSNKSGTLAQQQRIQNDIDACQAEKEKAHLVHNKLVDAGMPLRSAVENYKEGVRKYEEHLAVLTSYRELSGLLDL